MAKKPPSPKKKPLTERERKSIAADFNINQIGQKITAHHKDGYFLELICTLRQKQHRPTDTPSDSEDLRHHLDGFAVLNDCRFTIHIYETPTKKYCAEGKVSLIDPDGNHIMQKRGSARRKVMAKSTTTDDERRRISDQKRSEKLNINRIFPVRDINDFVSIVMAIHDKADEMYKENLSTIASLLQGHEDSVLHPLTMYELNIKPYINSRSGSVTSRTQTDWMRDIKKICLGLNGYPVSEIPDLAIRSLRGNLGTKPDKKLRLAESFFTFCQACGAYQGENPFSRFVDHHTSDKSSRDGLVRAKLGRIDMKYEIELNARIQQNWRSEPKWLALLLAKEGHFNVGKIAQLQWRDLIFKDQMVIVSDNHPEYAGSLKNYSRPILPFGTQLLTEVHNELLSCTDETALAEMYVVSQLGDPYTPVKTSSITRFLRESLYAVGVPCEVMQQAISKSTGKKGGAGIHLLHRNYEDVLATVCKIPEESGIFHFLCGNVPTDTLTKYYRALGDDSARDTLNTLLRRDGRFINNYSEVNKESDEITVVNAPISEAENTEIEVPAFQELVVNPVSASHLTGVTGDIYLPKGTSVTFSVPHGIEGEIRVRKVIDGKEVRSKRISQLSY